MFYFDLAGEPLTNLELKNELQLLKTQRKVQIKYSCISDVLHAFVFIALYFGSFLSGYAVLGAVSISSVIALFLVLTGRKNLKVSNQIAITALTVMTTSATIIILVMVLKQPLYATIVAGLATGSIVIVGATLGRQVKMVMVAIEEMKPIIDDELGKQEIVALCREFPELDAYRETARQNLRP
ncbi:MAG: hypothetical protein KAU22_10910, partial [Desulfuromonadales bacterium]|nr:hypothetical protein [Desulfuromonadales bacterium]